MIMALGHKSYIPLHWERKHFHLFVLFPFLVFLFPYYSLYSSSFLSLSHSHSSLLSLHFSVSRNWCRFVSCVMSHYILLFLGWKKKSLEWMRIKSRIWYHRKAHETTKTTEKLNNKKKYKSFFTTKSSNSSLYSMALKRYNYLCSLFPSHS